MGDWERTDRYEMAMQLLSEGKYEYAFSILLEVAFRDALADQIHGDVYSNLKQIMVRADMDMIQVKDLWDAYVIRKKPTMGYQKAWIEVLSHLEVVDPLNKCHKQPSSS